jgi:hypothetical protein
VRLPRLHRDQPAPDPYPTEVRVTDRAVRDAMAVALPWHPVLGLDIDGLPVHLELGTGRHPHVVVTAPTGRGATAMLRTIAAQCVRDGARLWVIDPRGRSHNWARYLPEGDYATERGDIEAALQRVAAIIRQRSDTDAPTAPSDVVVVEDVATLSMWRREGGPGSKACDTLAEVVLCGRAFGVHVAASVGIGGARAVPASLGAHLPYLAAGSLPAEAWRRLGYGGAFPVPPLDRRVGRWQVLDAGGPPGRVFHGLYLTPDEALDLARNGKDVTP